MRRENDPRSMLKMAAGLALTVWAVALASPVWAAPEATTPSQQGQVAGETPTQPGAVGGSLYRPCWSDGRCELKDLVLTGTAFANLLMQISAALFFVSFVYGGGMYLMSFGKKNWVEKGTNAMKGGAIGMLIVMAAWTIVSYLVKAFTS